jgi:O-acetyl-ADP-ribose deacetylase (regulator of RNase III)
MDSDRRELNIDITTITKGIIVHQVNCKGKMGAGVALSIKTKWPIVYESYMNSFRSNQLHLGQIFFIQIYPDLYVVNLCGQYNFGRTARYTNYEAVYVGLEQVNQTIQRYNLNHLSVYFPYKIGCNLAGGNWNIVKTIIHETITATDFYFTKFKS